MHIINKHGIHHTIPDEWTLPAGARRATDAEIVAYEAANEAKVAALKPATDPNAEKDLEIARLKADLEAARQPTSATPAKATK